TTFSYNIAPLIAAFVPGRGGVSEDEAAEWLNDLAELQNQGRYFFSVNRYLFAASRPRDDGPRSATGPCRSDALACASVLSADAVWPRALMVDADFQSLRPTSQVRGWTTRVSDLAGAGGAVAGPGIARC